MFKIALTFATLIVASLGFGQEAPVNLRMTIWSGSEEHLALLNGFADAYKGEHPNVSVQFDVIPFGDYVQKVTIQLAGGNPPDLGWLAEASAPAFIDAGVLEDLGPTVREDTDYDFADFSEPTMQLWVDGDAVYGIPFSTSPFITYFNRDMFEAAGLSTPNELAEQGSWTWEALKNAAATMAETAPAGTYGFESVDGQGYSERVWHTLIPIVRAYGGEAWDEAGTECLLNSPEAVEAVTMYHGMIFGDRSVVPPGEQGDFFTGNAAMTVNQLSRVSKLEGAAFKWGVAPLPNGPAGEVAVIGQAALVAFRNGPNTDVARDFLAFMTNQENVAAMAAYFPPARTSVLSSDAFLTANPLVTPEQMNIVAQGIEQGTVLPSHPSYPQIEATALPIFDQLWRPDVDVQVVLDEVCSAITPLLAQQ